MAMARFSALLQPRPDLTSLGSSRLLFQDSSRIRCYQGTEKRGLQCRDAGGAAEDRNGGAIPSASGRNAGRRTCGMRSRMPCNWTRQFRTKGRLKTLMAGNGQSFIEWLAEDDQADKNAAEENPAVEILEGVRQAEIQRTDELEEAKRILEIQMHREAVMVSQWENFLQKFQGKLRGTEVDPIASHDIPFSDFWKLLEQNRVQYLDYKDLGRETSVVLPYFREKEEGVSAEAQQEKDPSNTPIVYKRHIVEQMPIDAWNDVWRKLHEQLVHVEVENPNVFTQQIYPTIETAMIWALRLFVAIKVYGWLDEKLYPIYKLKSTERRPVKRRPKLSTGDMELGALGQSRARFISAEESTGVTFDDFAGQEYVKRELQEVVNILKDDKEFEDLGIYCPKGVLLYGPPGTGKTLLAKAIAGEAGVPFFSASGSEFVEMFVGVAAARVRDLFSRARQYAPSIIFIDEIDAIGAKRGGPDLGGGGIEREQGLVQILTELDGFQSQSTKVLVVGATNRLDMLDPALLRKGRFDKTIAVGLPTEEGRLAILKVHARNKMFRSEAEKEQLLKEIAKMTYDFSGAELQNVLNEAGILAARSDKDIIERPELLESLKRQEGTFSTGQEDAVDVTGEARLRIAYREASIAVLECSLPNSHRPFTKTNIRDIDTFPNFEYSEPRHRVFAKKSDIVDSIIRSCAPKIAEEQIFGSELASWNSGTAFGEAGLLADYLILKSGMTALGKIYHHTQQDVMVHFGPKVVALRNEYMRFAVEKCSSLLKEYRSALETIAARLLEKEELTAAEIWDVFENSPRIPQPPVRPVDEHGALVYAGRWGIYGVTLPGRVTFTPGNVGFATFGAPRPQQLQVIKDETWKMMDALAERNIAQLAKKYEETEETGNIFSQQFL